MQYIMSRIAMRIRIIEESHVSCRKLFLQSAGALSAAVCWEDVQCSTPLSYLGVFIMNSVLRKVWVWVWETKYQNEEISLENISRTHCEVTFAGSYHSIHICFLVWVVQCYSETGIILFFSSNLIIICKVKDVDPFTIGFYRFIGIGLPASSFVIYRSEVNM